MKTCKDCLHCNVCEKRTCSECQGSFCDECGIYSEYDGRASVENCTDFKDKSLDLDLPCKVGDVVYFAVEHSHNTAEIDGIHIDEQGIHFSWVQYDVGVDTIELWDEGEFDIDEIGETVFLTIESMEQALKEHRNDCV